MRAQFPKHVAPFVQDFKEQQQKLIASYHGIHDGKDFNHDRRSFDDLYQRVALPIEKGGMALNNAVYVSLTAFACSIAASMKELAKVFPDWIRIGSDGKLVNVVCHKSPDVADQIVDFAHEYRLIAPQGPFKEGDDFLAVMKSIEAIDARRGATTVQGVLYSHLIEEEASRLLETAKRKANESRGHTSHSKVKWRNWFSLMNSDSGAWLTAGLSPKLFVMSNDEFISAICRRNTVQDPRVPKYTSALSRESYDSFQCACDGGAQPKVIDPFGYHLVGCKIGANAIRLHDQVVVLIARLFRSLRLEAIVEPIRLFEEASPNSENQRPDILIRHPRGFGRPIILDVAITGIDGQSRPTEESPDRHLQVRYDQKIAKYGNIANTSGFQLIPAVFSHTGQIHTVFKDFIREQIRQKFVHFENQAKPSKINSVFKWWSKCVSMVIAKTASRNVIYKANKLAESMFVRQSEMLIPEEELGSQSPVSYEEDFEDLSSNVDLYVFNDQMVQGYRGVNINSRHNEESLGELYRKDDIDVSNQEHTAPVYFQSLSLD